jgi:hypothetical protein
MSQNKRKLSKKEAKVVLVLLEPLELQANKNASNNDLLSERDKIFLDK